MQVRPVGAFAECEGAAWAANRTALDLPGTVEAAGDGVTLHWDTLWPP